MKQSLNLGGSFVKTLHLVLLGHNLTLQAVVGYEFWKKNLKHHSHKKSLQMDISPVRPGCLPLWKRKDTEQTQRVFRPSSCPSLQPAEGHRPRGSGRDEGPPGWSLSFQTPAGVQEEFRSAVPFFEISLAILALACSGDFTLLKSLSKCISSKYSSDVKD